jgi:hypothetical protein
VIKVCRACHSEIADGAVICPCCGRLQSIFPPALTKHQRAWSFAALCVCVLGVASAVLAVGVVRHYHSPPVRGVAQKLLHQSTGRIVYERSFTLVEETRKVYPYSIVPGGAATVEDAKLAMHRADVQANYTNVDFAKLHQVRLDTNLAGYVSYRYGEKIYWTAKKLTLRKGETVFTDGVHIVRGRCLNCYSAVPMLPIRPHEPSEKVLDIPVDVPVFAYKFPLLPVEAPTLPPAPEELTPVVPILPVAPPAMPGVPGGGIWFPIVPIIPPIHRHPGHNPPPGGGGPPIPPIIPPLVVPEPRYGVVVAAMVLAMALAYRSRRRSILRQPNLSTEKVQPGGINVVDP